MDTRMILIIDHIANTVEPHTHDFFQMIFCQKKGGEITIGNKTFEAKQDHIYFIKAGTLHAIKQKNNMKVVDLKFSAFGDALLKYLSNIPEEFQISDISFMKMMFSLISKEGIDGNIYCNQIISSALKLLLAKIIHEFNEKEISAIHDYQVYFKPPQHSKNNTDTLIFDLKNYIEQNIHRTITLDELANKTNLNKTYFIKRFKFLFEETPINYILNMRIEKAKKLIVSENLSIQEISERVGFNSLHYFSMMFKKIEGLSPTEYQKYFNGQ